MTSLLLLFPIVVSLLVTLLLMPFWIKKAHNIGLLWDDMNKHRSEKVAGSGGILVLLGFTAGVFLYVTYRVFYLKEADGFLVELFALLTVVLLVSMLGFVDDLLGWQRGGLSKRARVVFVAFAAIPLMAINAGLSEVSIPLFGVVELGLLYPVILIPLGIIGATTTFNFLAGFNGLEAGQGIIILSGLSLVAFLTGSTWLALVALCMVASLLGFLFYNFCPAKVFPGDSMTYAVGSLIAIMAIIGNFERVAVFFFIPNIIEVILKTRGRLMKHSFGKPNSDGGLSLRYDKIYSLNHAGIYFLPKIGVKPSERNVVYAIWAFQLLVILLGLAIFWRGIVT